jgi:hypothetical protein
MLDTFGFPTPQGSNYQEFYGGGSLRDWIKPRGASMVRMLLIGAGAGGRAGSSGAGGAGGGSGAITQWIGPAIFIPDQLRITIGAGGASDLGGGNTTVIYQAKNTTGYNLLTASGAASTTAGTAFANNYFGASGIFNSIAGQAGTATGVSITASTTTVLSGGAGGSNVTNQSGGLVGCKYGYPDIIGGVGSTGGNGNAGFFLIQPIMIGAGGSGGGGSTTAVGGNGGNGGIGCGGGGGGICTSGASSLGGRGGDGAVFIWAW